MQLDPTFECTAQAAWMSESMKVGNHFTEFWWLIRKCHYLSHYSMNRCIHMVFSHYISNVINEYTIHFDNYYCKNVEFGHRKEVCFWLRPNLWPTTVQYCRGYYKDSWAIMRLRWFYFSVKSLKMQVHTHTYFVQKIVCIWLYYFHSAFC